MWEAIKAMLSSKKFLATLAGVVVALLAKIGFDIDETIVVGLLGAVAAYVLGQGLADQGKEAAKKE